MKKDECTIRDFRPADADACFRIRSAGFINRFYTHLGPEKVAALVNSYMPADFVRMSDTMKWLVCEHDDNVAGFCAVNFLDDTTAEILFLYVRLDLHGRGLGTALLDAARGWLRANRPEITTLVLDTVVPGYNRVFYEKQGFVATGRQTCVRDGLEIPSVVMSRPVKR